MTEPPSPEEWHERNHVFPGPRAECRDCAKQIRKCGGKITYPDVHVAAAEAQRVNVERGWQPSVRPYGCRYCGGYHLATARRAKALKRVERDRRKWLRRTA